MIHRTPAPALSTSSPAPHEHRPSLGFCLRQRHADRGSRGGERASQGPSQARPPLLLRSCPLIQPPLAEHKNSTRLAASSGVPRRSSGVWRRTACLISSLIQPVSTG